MSVNISGFRCVSGDEVQLTGYLAVGSGCTAGSALAASSTAGYLTKATAGTIKVLGVAAQTVTASTAAVEQSVQYISLGNNPRFVVGCDAAPTAGNLAGAHALATALTINPDSTPATTGVFWIEEICNAYTNSVIGRFCKTPFANDRV